MVNVAVAGGTSPTLGRCIVEALVATEGKHQVIILSRASPDKQHTATAAGSSNTARTRSQTKYGAPIVPVNYDDESSITAVLQEHNIHTLISVMRLDDLAAMVRVHGTMLAAAQAARVSRFILSDWSMGPLAANSVDVLAHKNELHEMGQRHMQQQSAGGQQQQHVVECSTMQNGGFMEYFAQGSADSWFEDPFYVDYIDVSKDRLVQPCNARGTPSTSTFTSLKDIGRFVAAAMDLGPGKLVGRIGMKGQDLPNYEVVADVLKNQCGRDDVKVTDITPADCEKLISDNDAKFQQALQKGEFDLNSFMVKATAQMIKVMCEGQVGGGIIEGKLNQLCPQVRPVQVQEMVAKTWGKK